MAATPAQAPAATHSEVVQAATATAATRTATAATRRHRTGLGTTTTATARAATAARTTARTTIPTPTAAAEAGTGRARPAAETGWTRACRSPPKRRGTTWCVRRSRPSPVYCLGFVLERALTGARVQDSATADKIGSGLREGLSKFGGECSGSVCCTDVGADFIERCRGLLIGSRNGRSEDVVG